MQLLSCGYISDLCLYRRLSHGGHVESEENKKLFFFFCTTNLALNSRLAEACRAKTKRFTPPVLNIPAE